MIKIGFIFDLDDTLIKTHEKYELVRDTIIKNIEFKTNKFGLLKKEFNELDKNRVEIAGFGKEKFITSLLLIAMKYGVYSFELERLVRGMYKDIIEQGKYEIIPHIADLFKFLQDEGHSLLIGTMGDRDLQKRKIKNFFKDTNIKPVAQLLDISDNFIGKKDFEFFSKAKDYFIKEGCEFFVSVGNSLKFDIFPAIENGFFGIYIKTKSWDFFNNVKIPEKYKNAFLTITETDGLVDILENLNKKIGG